VLFYINHPIREIRGTGDFEERVVGKIEELWRDYSGETVFKSHDEYLEFMQDGPKLPS
jgi:predicted transcriptional regulator